MKTIKTLYSIFGMLLLVACDGRSSVGVTPGESPTPPPAVSKLVTYGSCDELLTDMKADAITQLNATMDAYLTPSCYNAVSVDYEDGTAVASSEEGGDSSSSSDATASDFTTTNLQEAGVDETDIIKTDGTYIYVATNRGVDIFKAWPKSSFARVASIAVTDGAQDLFLTGSTLVVVSQVYDDQGGGFGGGWCGTVYPSFATRTRIESVNVSDPKHPVSNSVLLVDGAYQSARMVNNVAHFAVTATMDPVWSEYPTIDWEAEQRAACDNDTEALAELTAAVETARAANLAMIEAAAAADFLPSYDTGNGEDVVDCTAFAKEEDTANSSLTGLVSVPVDNLADVSVTFVRGSTSVVYASTEAFYMASTNWADGESTLIHRFALGGENKHAYFGSASVSGWIDNQFSMSEYNGTFRIATTNGHVARTGESGSSSNVYVLDATDSDLPQIGAVEGIGLEEQIYAARFIGDRGYLVTFKKIDPLFVIDLSDPTSPTVAGELEMPGYSTYLHPVADGRLLGLGKDADDQGDFAWYQGVKLALFDVADATSPSLLDDDIIGSRGTDSPALEESHAFTYDDSTGDVVLPISLYEGGSGGSNMGEFQSNAIYLYHVGDELTLDAQIDLNTSSGQTPQRTLFLSDESSTLLYVLDSSHLYQIDRATNTKSATGLLNGTLPSAGYYW
jgi:uncharacterized secreted protein with C-terminal beta-propeller domain